MERRSFMARTLALGAGLICTGNGRRSVAAPLPALGTGWAVSPFARAARQIPPVTSGRTIINVRRLGAKGDGRTDDTVALQEALTRYDRVYLPPGTYLVNNLQLKTGNELFGNGNASVIKQHPAAQWAVSANPGSGGTPNPRDNMRNLHIHDLKFLGPIGHLPFDEHVHLLNLNAVTGVMINRCTFAGYLGDGIYLGSSNDGALERHNQQVLVQDCLFDGMVKYNRNGISIIDGSAVIVRRCAFTRSGNRSMPAGIDIEPNPSQDAYVRIQGIWIDRCSFSDMGAMAMICIPLQPQAQLGHPASHISITNCHAFRPGSHDQAMFFVRQGEGVQPDAATPPLGLSIRGCRSDGIPAAMAVESVKGMQVSYCAFNHAAAPHLRNALDCTFSHVTVNGKRFQPGG